MVNIPQNVNLIKEENDLKLYHYTDDAQHPGPSDFWKGVVLDGNTVVARSYPWTPTIVTEDLPDNLVYTPLYESTILRFYKVDGKPMIGTHRQIDVSNKDSRVSAASKRFIDLVNEAIKGWKYSEYTYTMPNNSRGLAYTPTSWEELCVDGWCHVFLLVDVSNQITDLTDLSRTYEITDDRGESDVVTFTSPKLIHAISFQVGGDVTPDGLYPMVPYTGDIIYDVPTDADGFSQYTWILPKLPVMSKDLAQTLIDDGMAVVGFSPVTPTDTFKYLSYEYARKLELAGETFNPIHRWHQLMDVSVEDATEYIQNLPYHLKHITLDDMKEAHARHLDKIVSTLAPNAVARFKRRDATMDSRIYKKVSSLIAEVVNALRSKYARNTPSDQELLTEAEALVLERVLALSYTDQHALHGTIQRVAREQEKAAQ